MPMGITFIEKYKELRVTLDRTAQILNGSGDMSKAIYDSNNDHIVDTSANSLKLGNVDAADYLKNTDVIDCGTF